MTLEHQKRQIIAKRLKTGKKDRWLKRKEKLAVRDRQQDKVIEIDGQQLTHQYLPVYFHRLHLQLADFSTVTLCN